MSKIIVLFIFSVFTLNAFCHPKIIFSKGKSKLLRADNILNVSRGMLVIDNDIIVTGPKGLVIVKSKASTYKVSKNSRLELDLSTKEIINSDINYGSVVVEFLKEKLNDSKGKTLQIKSKTAILGVRGTKFFAHVDPQNENSILSVDHGSVAFRGRNSKKERLVKRKSSSMTNKNSTSLRQRKFGFESKINWNVSESKGTLNHKKGLYLALSKTWNKYKDENAKKWGKRADEMKNLWNNN